MDPEYSLPCLQKPTVCPHTGVQHIYYNLSVLYLRSILLLSSNIRQIGLFSSDIQFRMLYAFIVLSSRILVTLFDGTIDLIYKHS